MLFTLGTQARVEGVTPSAFFFTYIPTFFFSITDPVSTSSTSLFPPPTFLTPSTSSLWRPLPIALPVCLRGPVAGSDTARLPARLFLPTCYTSGLSLALSVALPSCKPFSITLDTFSIAMSQVSSPHMFVLAASLLAKSVVDLSPRVHPRFSSTVPQKRPSHSPALL
jgi:hypothetical protein